MNRIFLFSLFAMLLIVAGTANAENVTFNTRSWDEENKEVVTTTDTKNCAVLEGNHPDDWIDLDNGYYVTRGGVNYKVLNIVGSNVHLILEDGATLYCKHVKLETGHSLSIFSQSDGESQGKLIADNTDYKYAAGIGGGDEATSGTLIIHGGKIEARGYRCAAGIGGGDSGSCGDVIVYGGHTIAIGGKKGSGIGGGEDRGINWGNSVNIYGGIVEAYGNNKEYLTGGCVKMKICSNDIYNLKS